MTFNLFKNTDLFPIKIGILFVLIMLSCGSKSDRKLGVHHEILKQPLDSLPDRQVGARGDRVQDDRDDKYVIVGASQTEAYLRLLSDKRVGLVANQTSVVFKAGSGKMEVRSHTHLVDSLLGLGINIIKVFAPEHGFRGAAGCGGNGEGWY